MTYADLKGKVAVVTGGSRGIGAATVRALAEHGVRVAVNGRDPDAVDAMVAELWQAGATATGVVADVTDAAAVTRMRDRVEGDLGPVDIVAAFAGGGLARPGIPLDQYTEEEWHASIDGNLTATFLTLRAFLPAMRERGRGSIITMASSAAREPTPAPAPYAAAKAGIIMLTRHVAAQEGPYGLRVNCLSPAMILTERTSAHVPAEQRDRIAARYPMRRLGEPDDVAAATLFLASDASSWLTGLVIDVAGGSIMR